MKNIYEGTWEEIQAYAAELMGQHVRVTILDVDSRDREASKIKQALQNLDEETSDLMPHEDVMERLRNKLGLQGEV